jgi:uncharacterized membrane protein
MATLVAIKFPTVSGADTALKTLEQLQKQELIHIQDAAVVTWEAGKDHPKTRQVNSLVGAGALGGMFWGMLFGLIFFIPVIGAAVGLGIGALAGSLAKVGIDEGFINSVKSKITPGTSALFVLSAGAVMDRVEEAFRGQEFEIMATNLSHEQEEELRNAFSHDEEMVAE